MVNEDAVYKRIRRLRPQNPYDFLAQSAEEALRGYQSGRISEEELNRRLAACDEAADKMKQSFDALFGEFLNVIVPSRK